MRIFANLLIPTFPYFLIFTFPHYFTSILMRQFLGK